MTPWFTMPRRPDARRRALADDLRTRLEAVACTVRLLRAGTLGVRERQLLDRLDDEVAGIARALERSDRDW